eukprot:6522718-Heterocapsa_arctica.AAC.1
MSLDRLGTEQDRRHIMSYIMWSRSLSAPTLTPTTTPSFFTFWEACSLRGADLKTHHAQPASDPRGSGSWCVQRLGNAYGFARPSRAGPIRWPLALPGRRGQARFFGRTNAQHIET